ncbi:MAG: hypothetical protein ACK4GT_20310 [Pararhodobacter sp.]
MRPAILACLAVATLTLPLGGCVATKLVTVPVSLAASAVEGAGKGVMYVGGQAVRITGDALDGPDERVRLSVTYQRGRNSTRTETKVIKTKDLEREVNRMSRKGKVIDVAVERLA